MKLIDLYEALFDCFIAVEGLMMMLKIAAAAVEASKWNAIIVAIGVLIFLLVMALGIDHFVDWVKEKIK